jgi:CBS domain-containing protein
MAGRKRRSNRAAGAAKRRTAGGGASARPRPARRSARVAELCVREVETVAPNVGVRDAAKHMAERAVGTLVVVDELTRPLGIVTDRDLMVRCIASPTDARRTGVSEIMSNPVAWIHEHASAEDALEEMARLRVRRLVVVDERDRLVGLLALDDVLLRELGAGSALGRVLRRTMG